MQKNFFLKAHVDGRWREIMAGTDGGATILLFVRGKPALKILARVDGEEPWVEVSRPRVDWPEEPYVPGEVLYEQTYNESGYPSGWVVSHGEQA